MTDDPPHRPHLTAADIDAELTRQTGLAAVHDTFRRWLGDEYDLGSLDAVLCAAATHYLDGDPPWLLVVSGSGNAKTETVMSLSGIGAHIKSTVTSEGALLSASSAKDKTKGATGGLLREIGDAGIMVIKDFTSIISMNRDLRAAVLGALREVYDGRWDRAVGTDGGRTLTWQGRIVLIGAVTTAYDTAHAVIASMGDRFILVRVSSTTGRLSAGRHALRNVGNEVLMRTQLADAVNQLIAHHLTTARAADITDADMATLLGVANLVTYARTAVERDYQGNVTDAHEPEMPTRFAKMLGQLVRGGLTLGMDHDRALSTAVRVAGDSMPPLRLAILGDILTHPYSITQDVKARLQKPRNTVDRELQALHLLGLLEQHQDEGRGWWRYTLSGRVDQGVLKAIVSRNVDVRDANVILEHPFDRTDVLEPGGTGVRGISTPVQVTGQVFEPSSTDVRESDTPVLDFSTGEPKSERPEKSVSLFLGFRRDAIVRPETNKTGYSNECSTIPTGSEGNPAPIPVEPLPAPAASGVCPDCLWPVNSRGHLQTCLPGEPA